VPFAWGDVNGDGVLSFDDAVEIMRYVARGNSIIRAPTAGSPGNNSFYAAAGLSSQDPYSNLILLHCALHIKRAIVGLPNVISVELPIQKATSAIFRAEICYSSRLIRFYNENEIANGVFFAANMNITGVTSDIRRVNRSIINQGDIYVCNRYGVRFDMPSWRTFHCGTNSEGSDFYQPFGMLLETVPADSWLMSLRFTEQDTDISVTGDGINSFTLCALECCCECGNCEVCGFCECGCCEHCGDCGVCCDCDPCNNCESCGYLGGKFGFGRVTDSGEPSVHDALAILRYISGFSSPIADCLNARAAASITNPATGKPTEQDALQILRFVAGLPNMIDGT
jgi:hypothetical protein